VGFMTSRRQFLHAAALSSGLPALLAAGDFMAARPQARARLGLHMVLVDGRHAETRPVGAYFSRGPAVVRTLPDGDITQTWLNDLGPAWGGQPHAIAGLTERPALFCLEQLALHRGLRVVFHGEHVIEPDGHLQHSLLRGAEEAHLSVDDLARAGARWPRRIAATIAAYRRAARPRRLGPSEASLEPALPPGARLLTSWIIAPV
jgi:hypothetical protein